MTQSGHEQWLRIFDVPETKLHQDGYTIYKIVSTLLHRSFPEASTSLEVWRRYSAILKLHKEIIKLHHHLKLPESPPACNKPSIVKRFDGEVIENRRKCTLILLNYCAKYPSIYASEQFTLFFKEDFAVRKKRLSFSKPKEKKRSNSLAASLGISEENGEYSFYSQLNENTSSSEDLSGRTADVSIANNAGASALHVSDSIPSVNNLDHTNSHSDDIHAKSSSYPDGNVYTTDAYVGSLPGLKNAQNPIPQNNYVQMYVESSPNRRRVTALNTVQNVSLKSSSSANHLLVDSMMERKKEVRKRNSGGGYLHKAEKLISKLSLREGRRLLNRNDPAGDSLKVLKGLTCDLNNYRVVGSSGNVIVAIDMTNQETVAIKVIEKSSNLDEKGPLLPHSVPFMVPILRYHETEFAYYLILKYISGGKVWNHLKKFIKQPLSNLPHCESASKSSSTYEGQRLIFDDREENPSKDAVRSMMKNIEEDNDPSLRDCDISDKDLRSLSFASNLAVAECRSSVDRFPNSPFRKDVLEQHHQSSLINIIDFQPLDERGARSTSIPQGKSKSLDELSSTGESPKKLNGDRDSLYGKVEDGMFKMYKDNDSIGSDTLSGVSEDFSCSSLNLISDNDNPDMEKSSAITSYSWPKSVVGNSAFDVNSIIENSKKLLCDVNRTLARSKQQIVRTFSTPKDLVSMDNSGDSVSCYADVENSNYANVDADVLEPTSLYLSAKSNSVNKENIIGQDPLISPLEAGCFGNIESLGTSTLPEIFISSKGRELPSSSHDPIVSLQGQLVPQTQKTPDCQSFLSNSPDEFLNNPKDLSVPFLFENTQYSSSLTEGSHPIPEGLVRVWASQVITALDHLHKQDIIWGDFNPSNLLLDEGGSILVTYNYSPCNISRFYGNEGGDSESSWLLSLGYKAPELSNPVLKATDTADWWSVGALLFHLLTGKDVASCFPCGFTSHSQIYFPSNVSEEADSLISNLLCAYPLERLGSNSKGVQEIKDHPFFYGIEWPD